MKAISERLKLIQPSPIRKMFNLAGSKSGTVNLVLGEPDFTTPPNIIEASHNSFMMGHTHYVHNSGILELRNVISKRIESESNQFYDGATQIVITAGGQEALYLTMQILLNPGDEVILAAPFYSPYINEIRLGGGKPVCVTTFEKNGFSLKAEDVEIAITKHTKAILLNSPGNPTGGVIDFIELEKIAELAKKFDLYVISDDVYKYFLYDEAEYTSIASFPGMAERTIIIDSMSKSYAMTGWRIGYVACPVPLYSKYMHFQENVMSCVNVGAQYAAIEALQGSQDSLHAMIDEYKKRRYFIVEGLNRIPRISCIAPKGAFYVFANMSRLGISSEEFALRLYDEANVLLVPGTAFGDAGEGFFRISYATSLDVLDEGINRIDTFCSRRI